MDFKINSAGAIAAISLMTACSLGQDFKNSIVSTDFDFITAEDPSTFEQLQFVRLGSAEMPDKRGDRELFQEAYEFAARFSDLTRVSIFIEAANRNRESARVEAMRFVHPLGKLPTSLREGVQRLCVHNGGKNTSAFSDSGLIILYADNASIRIANHDLEETIFHESVHAAWDIKYAQSDKWKRAQLKDGSFVTLYARSKPEREDLAESALFAFTIVHHPERLPESVRKKIKGKIGHRILFVEELIPHGTPIHYQAKIAADKTATALPAEESGGPLLCDIRNPGIAADILSHCLLTDFEIPESKVHEALKRARVDCSSSNELFVRVVETLNIEAEALKRSTLQNLYINCKDTRPPKSIDKILRNQIDSWSSKKNKT